MQLWRILDGLSFWNSLREKMIILMTHIAPLFKRNLAITTL
jgi:hypothetical protein